MFLQLTNAIFIVVTIAAIKPQAQVMSGQNSKGMKPRLMVGELVGNNIRSVKIIEDRPLYSFDAVLNAEIPAAGCF